MTTRTTTKIITNMVLEKETKLHTCCCCKNDRDHDNNDNCSCCSSSSTCHLFPPLDQITVTTSTTTCASSGTGGMDDCPVQQDGDDDDNASMASTCSSLSCLDSDVAQPPKDRMVQHAPEKKDDTTAAGCVSSSTSRSIFSDYWKAQGHETGTCPFEFRPSTPPFVPRKVPARADQPDASSCSSATTSNRNKACSPRPARRSIFGGVTATTNTTSPQEQPLVAFVSSPYYQQPLVPLRPVKSTQSSPSLLYSNYYSILAAPLATRKTQSHSALQQQQPRPSVLRRNGRFGSYGGGGDTAHKKALSSIQNQPTTTTTTAHDDGHAPPSRRPSVSFQAKVQVTVVPAASGLWTDGWASEDWSDWFA
ncbi:hypothetical protein ACA910_009570 [Epithemia clementina (nom. ined.)]